MDNILKLLIPFIFVLPFFGSAQQQDATFSISPTPFNENQEITIIVSDVDASQWGVTDVYLWAWYFDSPSATNAINSPTNGEWTNSNESQKMIDNGDGTFSYSFTPTSFYNATGIDRIGMLVKAKDGTGDKKTQDNVVQVGNFQVTLTQPSQETTLLNSGDDLLIQANSSVNATFQLKANNTVINTTSTAATNYSFTATDLTVNTNFELIATSGSETKTQNFKAVIKPTVIEEALPSGLVDGINFDEADATKVTLVLFAPEKEFVHVIGDFNNWSATNSYLMKKDPATNRFWIELTGLTPQFDHLYQYLVEFDINIPDPYSTTILDGFGNDDFISNTTYPDLPSYPAGQTQAITVLRTGEPEYVWQHTNFTKPKKEDLVIYELLIRDFDELHSFDAVRTRLDYLQNLGINAIELMPINEFDGNESWGYNVAFHMALDKYYGNKNAFKQFIDECHARGIAVIIDVVYNHASGQHPYYRMWNTDDGGTGGQAADNNPFFNATPRHSFNVFNDFNHQSSATQLYVNQTVSYWINEFNIDGMRWDLTKGFTQNCTASDQNCTNSLQQDRIDVLKGYADNQWASDPNFYVIFEHLGGLPEEEQWANYRIDEGKGIMLWNKQTNPYNEATLGYHENGKSNFSGVSYQQKGFDQPSAVSYMESHDEERLMFKNLEFGNGNDSYQVTELNTALSRIKTAGAFFFTVPGPKMIWQFGELGYDVSIDFNGRTGNKPIRWEYANNPNRKNIYNVWSDLIKLKTDEAIFETNNFDLDLSKSNGLKTIHLTNSAATGNEIQYVTVIGNFGITAQEINPNFQETGVWYEFLKFNKKTTISNTQATITLQPGEFRIYGDQPSLLFPLDDDGDGVPNSDDVCPNTAEGAAVDVNGCEIFSLPTTNFTINTFSETCRSSNDGSISIRANENYNYTVTISGPISETKTFTETTSFDNLEAGNYSICITIDEQDDYQQCFNSTITEPSELTVSAKIDFKSSAVTLSLKGGENYIITLNDKVITTSNNEITLDLIKRTNLLHVKTDKDCQGSYAETIILNKTILIYPNPVSDGRLFIDLGLDNNIESNVRINNASGKEIINQLYQPVNNQLLIDLSNVANGLYFVSISNDKTTVHYKILKQ
ncbi:alpha-amylase family glycosyl hydrolase [Spongiivirga sp. MCCC 1A20706]|uniref:alpha-amylase family glycosyl hydrolase n=1 Tax=Spongiivirga sp. MCCC 1A20706 TaxID=3160963 RepID=UPI00397748F1